ncbi:MAG: hypothetical protein K8U57_31620 [Planctomycetes bacterium]|nr:hypothetical protein [Planctomycetota bacterium]
MSILYGTFSTLRDEYGDPVTLTRRQELRVRRWCRLLHAANGLIDSDPLIEDQVRRLAAVFEQHNAKWLRDLVLCRTGTKYPA